MLYDDIDNLKAKDAADAASLMSGTVRASGAERIAHLTKALGCLLLALGIVARYGGTDLHLAVLAAVAGGMALVFGWRMLSSCVRSLTFDGFTGEITSRRLLHRTERFYVTQITQITRDSVQHGENAIRTVGYGRRRHIRVTAAHFVDTLTLCVGDAQYAVVLRRSSLGRDFKGYVGGDDGAEDFDRYLRLYERSRQPDAPSEDELFDARMTSHTQETVTAEMPTI